MTAMDRVKAVAPSYNVEIHMAGDIFLAADAIQNFVDQHGLCVALASQTFIYTGGREQGFKVGLINYPRFPKEPTEILATARELATHLRVWCGQMSYSIVTPDETIWVSYRLPDAETPTDASGAVPAGRAALDKERGDGE